jgi:hypothetical protein
MSKTIKVNGKRRKRVPHELYGDRLAEVCQNTVCHDAPYHSKKWIGAEEEGVMGYIVCDLHGVLLGIEKGGGRGGEWSCVFCECCRGTCHETMYGIECPSCGKTGKGE